MAQRLFDLPETKGAFQVKGIVGGVDKDSFYKEFTTRTNRAMRTVNFSVTYAPNKTLFLSEQGMEMDNVFFSCQPKNKGEKSQIEKVAWADRFTFMKDGFRLIGNNIGITKTIDDKGKSVNNKKILTDFDTCAELNNNLQDDMSVFTKGNIEFSSYIDNRGEKRVLTRLKPNQISLCKEVDFTDEDYEQQNDFHQVIIFMGIEPEKDNNGKSTGRFVVSAKIVTYSTIEDVEFIIINENLARTFRKRLKAYNAIQVSGHIESSIQAVEVSDDDDEWGEEDKMSKVYAPVKRELIITGAKGSTIDTEVYSQEKIEDAMQKIANANKVNSDFSNSSSDDDWGAIIDDDEDEPW